ncbi:MAG TPA: sensor histidine kinase, partial [Lachnospiraceae bacterium]|nr:sensor histidine kinase [Lachnospiraceae bacterium]
MIIGIRFMIDKLLNRGLDFRGRLFNVLAIAGMMICITISVCGFFTNAGFWNIILNLASAVLSFCLLYYSNKSGKYQLCYMITITIVFLFLFPILFFTAGGYHGGMPSFFVFAVLFTVFMLKGKKLLPMTIIEILLYTAICIVAYIYPQSVNSFQTEQEVLMDTIIGFTSVSLALG